MICDSTEEAIANAVAHIKAGHAVAVIMGRKQALFEIMQAIADQIVGAECRTGQIWLGGRLVAFPRNPFTPGSHLFGHAGAVVCDPSIRGDIYGDGDRKLKEIVQDCHRRAGISA